MAKAKNESRVRINLTGKPTPTGPAKKESRVRINLGDRKK